jgi:hypothetical protein
VGGEKGKEKRKREWAGLVVLLGQLGYAWELEAQAIERKKGERLGRPERIGPREFSNCKFFSISYLYYLLISLRSSRP